MGFWKKIPSHQYHFSSCSVHFYFFRMVISLMPGLGITIWGQFHELKLGQNIILTYEEFSHLVENQFPLTFVGRKFTSVEMKFHPNFYSSLTLQNLFPPIWISTKIIKDAATNIQKRECRVKCFNIFNSNWESNNYTVIFLTLSFFV